jgi:hypothetical protein
VGGTLTPGEQGSVNMQKTARMVAVNEQGQRVGESHPRARLSDAEIDLMFVMRKRGVPVAEIARWFGRNRSYVWRVLHHRKRNQLAVVWKRCLASDSQP